MNEREWQEVELIENKLYQHYVDFLQGKVESRSSDTETIEVEEPNISPEMRAAFNEYYKAVIRPRIALTRKAIFYAIAQEVGPVRLRLSNRDQA